MTSHNQISEITDRIVSDIDPDRIILFGSRARGEHSEHSDFDLCVLKAGVLHRRDLAKRIYRLLYESGAAVDVIVETPERFEQLKGNRFLIYNAIAEQGRVIYDKPRSLTIG